MSESFEDKCARNSRVQQRYDELMQAGKHGHYETMFRVVHEEVEKARAALPSSPAPAAVPEGWKSSIRQCLFNFRQIRDEMELGENRAFMTLNIDTLTTALQRLFAEAQK